MSGRVWRAWPPRPELSGCGCVVPAETQRLAELEYVVVDVETTGGGMQRGHRVTEIALVRVDARGRVLDEYATLVDPERDIPRFITRLTNISNGMVSGAPRFRDIAGEVRRLLSGAVFVAHNAGFDFAFVSSELERARLRASWESWGEAGDGAGDGVAAEAERAARQPAPVATVPVAPVTPAGGGLALVRDALQAAGYAMVRREDGASPSVLVVKETRNGEGTAPLPGAVEAPGASTAPGPAASSDVAASSDDDASPEPGLSPEPALSPADAIARRYGYSALRSAKEVVPQARASSLCTVKLARHLVPELHRRSLDVLTDFFGLENEARHRAYGDARVTAALFRRLLDRLDEREIASWGELQALLRRRAPRRKRRALPSPVADA